MTRPPQAAASRRPPPAPAAGREPGNSGAGTAGKLTPAEAKGARLRRLLAAADWLALLSALCIATATTSTTDVGTLFWAVLFSPVWILVLKLHGLYDNDHRRIRHSTFDELAGLVSASALGTLALDGLLALSPAGPLSPRSAILVGLGALIGCFVLRAALRFAWHRLTGVATGVAIGSPRAAEKVARRVATHPEARLQLIGYLRAPARCPGSAASPTSPGSPRSTRSNGPCSPPRS